MYGFKASFGEVRFKFPRRGKTFATWERLAAESKALEYGSNLEAAELQDVITGHIVGLVLADPLEALNKPGLDWFARGVAVFDELLANGWTPLDISQAADLAMKLCHESMDAGSVELHKVQGLVDFGQAAASEKTTT